MHTSSLLRVLSPCVYYYDLLRTLGGILDLADVQHLVHERVPATKDPWEPPAAPKLLAKCHALPGRGANCKTEAKLTADIPLIKEHLFLNRQYYSKLENDV